jgi:hypothetical protein
VPNQIHMAPRGRAYHQTADASRAAARTVSATGSKVFISVVIAELLVCDAGRARCQPFVPAAARLREGGSGAARPPECSRL